MALERITVWEAFQILTAAAQNGEFNNIVDYITALEVDLAADTAAEEARLDALEVEIQPIARGGTGAITAAAAFAALKQAATDAATGVVELATTAEINTGTDATRVLTPDAFAGSTPATRVVVIKVIADDATLATGDNKTKFTVPVELNGMNLVSVGAHVYTVSTSGLPTIQLARVRGGTTVDMLSTRITIDANEKDSATAATAVSINGSNDDVNTGDEIRVDVDVAGTGTTGLEVRLGFRLP